MLAGHGCGTGRALPYPQKHEEGATMEFLIVLVIICLLSKIKVGERIIEDEPFNPYDNGTAESYIYHNCWEFESVDDCFEFRELRQSGWRGGVKEFYEWKNEE